jgi:uncharacterized protein (TIGR03790 family)
MNFRRFILLSGLALWAGAWLRGAAAVPDNPAARVIILANSEDPDSVAIAHHYAERRGVPAANIFLLPLSTAETISRAEFKATLFQPLQDQLVRAGWIQGFALPPAGDPPQPPAHKYAMLGHHISYLVVCRGVPLRVDHDPALPVDSKQAQANPVFGSNAAAVDSELALLAQSGYPLTGYVPNPLFRNDHPIDATEQLVVKVGRLDGPAAADAYGLVDLALTAEATGLVGRGYVDLGGPYPIGDQWLEAAAKELTKLGFDGDVDRNPGTMPPEARCDAPVLYFGWYSFAVDGPFARPGFRFPPGAVALHINSYSATTMRSTTVWTPGLVARGATAAFGNVYEPYLQLTHEPQLILHALARGDTLGDAAAYAVPGYSWMGVLIGDPLYRPFKKSFDEQWRDRARLPPEQLPYLVLRRMRLLAADGKLNEALYAGQEAQHDAFSLPVALTLADLMRAAGDQDGAERALEPCLSADYQVKLGDAPLLAAVARDFEALGATDRALQAWQSLLTGQILTGDLRPVWLPPALAAARAAKDDAQAARWETELNELKAGAKPKG